MREQSSDNGDGTTEERGGSTKKRDRKMEERGGRMKDNGGRTERAIRFPLENRGRKEGKRKKLRGKRLKINRIQKLNERNIDCKHRFTA